MANLSVLKVNTWVHFTLPEDILLFIPSVIQLDVAVIGLLLAFRTY